MAQAKQKESVVRLKVGDMECEIDLEDLTLGELEEVEVYFDRPVSDVDFNSVRGTIFLAYLARRRIQPDWTLEETRGLRPNDLMDVKEAKRPTKPRAKRGSQSSSTD